MGFVALLDKDTITDVTESDIKDGSHIGINDITYAILKSALQDGFVIKVPKGLEVIDYPNLAYLKDTSTSPVTLYLANIYQSDRYYITGVSEKQSNEIFDISLYRVITKEVYEYLISNTKKMESQKIYIDENLEVITSIEQLSVITKEKENEELEDVRNSALTEGRYLILGRFDVSISLEFFTFIIMNNELASRGYIITDENREDKYMEIVNTDDEDLLNKLSDYLKALDELHKYKQYFVLYKNFTNKVNDEGATIETIKAALSEFKKEFK